MATASQGRWQAGGRCGGTSAPPRPLKAAHRQPNAQPLHTGVHVHALVQEAAAVHRDCCRGLEVDGV